jgi:hypothetical protein
VTAAALLAACGIGPRSSTSTVVRDPYSNPKDPNYIPVKVTGNGAGQAWAESCQAGEPNGQAIPNTAWYANIVMTNRASVEQRYVLTVGFWDGKSRVLTGVGDAVVAGKASGTTSVEGYNPRQKSLKVTFCAVTNVQTTTKNA